jgi:ATP-binding protein involved in chromosome partitioning
LPEVASPPLLEDAEAARQRVASRLAGVGRVLAVMSGKGGVGKSALAVNLAEALALRGQRVGLLDADLHGPSVAAMLGLRGQPVRMGRGDALLPVAGPLGLRVQSMDFFLQGNQPLDWDGESGEGATLRSAMEQAALADLLGQTDWGELDSLVVDLAPGSDRLPALARWLPPIAGALAVAIPTQVALLAVERSLRRAWAARIPLLGLVENMASSVCGACGAEGPLYREAPVEGLAEAMAVEVVARIPFDPELARAADAGQPFLAGPGLRSPAGRALAELAERVGAWEPPGFEEDTW